jgi:hypothetical protein
MTVVASRIKFGPAWTGLDRPRSTEVEDKIRAMDERLGFNDAINLTFEFEKLLRSKGIEVRPGSALEHMALSFIEALSTVETREIAKKQDLTTLMPQMIGVAELACHVLAVRDCADFDQLLPHLAALNDGSAIQNMPSLTSDEATNKIFELFIATLVMRCGKDVKLDHPKASKGDNPDVLATIAGRRWGIACKVLHGKHHEGILQNLEKGIDQIEKSPAETGIVVFNLKNVLQHSRYFRLLNEKEYNHGAAPLYPIFNNPDTPISMLKDEVSSLGTAITDNVPPRHVASLFEGKKSVPAFIFWAHIAAGTVDNGVEVLTSIRLMNLQPVGELSNADTQVVQCLHAAAFVRSNSARAI